MSFSFYHPESPFLPSDDWNICKHSEVPVTVIDNFYLSPELMLELSNKLAYTNHPKFTSFAPVMRAIFFANLEQVYSRLLKADINVVGEIGKLHTFNIQTQSIIREHSLFRCPHLDSNSDNANEWSILVYLSNDGVGTQFFDLPKGTTGCQTILSTKEYMEKWQLLLTVPGKFNRALIFPSASCYHKIDAGSAGTMGENTWRLFQVSTITTSAGIKLPA